MERKPYPLSQEVAVKNTSVEVAEAKNSECTMTGLTKRDRLVIECFKQLMLERDVPLHSTVLFGSRARGDYESDSDYDVLVVVEKLDRTIRQIISDCAWEAGFEDCLVITPVVVTRDEIDYSPFRSSLVIQAVQEDGILI